MSKKLPAIFKNTKEVIDNHNKSVFYSFVDNSSVRSNEVEENNANIPFQEISSYFNTLVEIKTKDKNYITKIISKVNDHILTIDKEIIYLKDILEIKEKSH